MVHIFCDLDGVQFDFEQGFVLMFGFPHNSVKDGKMWQLINSRPEFWTSLPRMHDAELLWDFIKDYYPTILTGCPPGKGFYQADEGKRKKCNEHFGFHVPVITDLSRNKPLHMKNPGDILIDDMEKNIRRWEDAGGRGVLHTSAESSIEQLKILLDVE